MELSAYRAVNFDPTASSVRPLVVVACKDRGVTDATRGCDTKCDTLRDEELFINEELFTHITE